MRRACLRTEPLQLLHLFPFGASKNVLGNVGLCLEDGWNFR